MNKQEFYLDQYIQLHKLPYVYPGSNSLDYKFITPLLKDYACKSAIDYGCGKAQQYTKEVLDNNFFGIVPTFYDPAVEKFSRFPSTKSDLVFCCDVLEHVPEEAVVEVLSKIFGLANKVVFIAVSNIPSKRILPCGENAHTTQKSVEWWMEVVAELTTTIPCLLVVRGTNHVAVNLHKKALVSYRLL